MIHKIVGTFDSGDLSWASFAAKPRARHSWRARPRVPPRGSSLV